MNSSTVINAQTAHSSGWWLLLCVVIAPFVLILCSVYIATNTIVCALDDPT